MVRPLRSQAHAGAIVQPEPPLFLLLLWGLQPFTSPDALDPLVVHVPACIVQQAGNHSIAIAAVFVSQFDDVVGQTIFICTALGHIALRRPVLPERAAGAAFRYAKLLLHMVDALAAT